MQLVTEAILAKPRNGRHGMTVFVLDNGETWEQTRPRGRVPLVRRGPVRVWSAGALHWLEMAGMKFLIPVERRYV